MSTLSTEQAPPISIPLRYFAIAPLFLLLAAAILAGSDPDPRSPEMLAATHCITIGFIGMIMMGALQQILPVVIGSTMPMPRTVAWLTFSLTLCGTTALSAGFLLKNPDLLNLAWPLLLSGFMIFSMASLISLSRAQAKNMTWTAILLAVLGLTCAVALGALLARGHAAGMQLDYAKLAAAHIVLALGGWVMLLIVGVSYQVVPMFQLTPSYPKWLTTLLTPALSGSLLWYLAANGFDAATGYAALVFWLLAGLCALAKIWPMPFTELSVIVFVLGFALSVVHGMLYKIVPFLVWFHLFRGGVKDVPNMKQIIPEVWMWRHFYLHTGTLLSALLTFIWAPARWLVAGGLALEGLLLFFAMYTGICVYHRTHIRCP